MAETPKQTQKKITSFTAESPKVSNNSSDEDESKMPKTSPKKKSKRKLEDTTILETPNKGENARENSTVNGDVSPSSPSSSWTFDQEQELFEKVGEYLESKESSDEAKKKTLFLKDIDWTEIQQVGGHTTQESKARFTVISKRVRKMRSASEILADMKTHHSKSVTAHTSRKRKAAVDPDLPKRPITSFMQFHLAKKAKILEKHPGLSLTEVSRKLGKRWKKLPEEKKQKYAEKYQLDVQVYNQKLVEYLKEHHPDVQPPLTAFDLWSVEESKSIKKDRPEISDKKLRKKLKRRWENMGESEKKRWDEMEKKGFKQFKKDCNFK